MERLNSTNYDKRHALHNWTRESVAIITPVSYNFG